MPDSPTSEPESAFVCDCEEWMRSACEAEPFYKEHGSKRYCVLHFPGKAKSAEFKKAFEKKLESKDFNFRGVWFPYELSFRGFDFTAETDFRRATLSARADFREATFSAKADFGAATFCAKADFSLDTKFRAEADFGAVTFNGVADFGGADFIKSATFSYAGFRGEAYFRKATFGAAVDFSRVTFDDYVTFAGEKESPIFTDESKLDLQFSRIETPDHVSFHMLALRPHWFVNVDARKFDFVNVKWGTTLNEEIKALIEKEVETPHRLLAIACWRLADNAEENHRYEEASKLRYLAMDVTRRGPWRRFAFLRRWFAFWKLGWWYWLASGYGERIWQAFVCIFGIWLLSALLYNQVGFARWEPKLASESDVAVAKRDDVGAPLKFRRAMTYSAAVMTLQKPEPRPATTWAQTVVLLETILGPVQAALLALAIRRKFMR